MQHWHPLLSSSTFYNWYWIGDFVEDDNGVAAVGANRVVVHRRWNLNCAQYFDEEAVLVDRVAVSAAAATTVLLSTLSCDVHRYSLP